MPIRCFRFAGIAGLTPWPCTKSVGLQTALGLVAAGIGVCLVPECVQQLRRGDVIYRASEDEGLVSPVIMSYRVHDDSGEIVVLLELIRELYRETWDRMTAPRLIRIDCNPLKRRNNV